MERTDGVSLSCVLDQMEQMSWCQITQPQATISQRLRVVVFVHSLACCIEELKRNHITWFFSLNAPPHILSCAQIPRCSVIHSVLLICSLLCQDLADVHIFGNCTATWCLIFSGGNESVTSTKVTTARSICYLACLMMYPGCFVLVCDRFSLPGGVDSAGSPPVVALWHTGPLLPLVPNVQSTFFSFFIMDGAHKMNDLGSCNAVRSTAWSVCTDIASDWCSLSVWNAGIRCHFVVI